MANLTHDYLNERGAIFLKREKGCGAVAIELKTSLPSIPDVIGFKSGCSYLIESKISRADYFADLKKDIRWEGSSFAVGNFRYYLCPEGMVQPEEVPEKWGLMYINERGQITIVKEIIKGNVTEGREDTQNRFNIHPLLDRVMLYSIARRK